MTTLSKAIEIALLAHKGQKDKSGAEYILHPLRVMEKGNTEVERICGILHDVVEDSAWTFEMLANIQLFFISATILIKKINQISLLLKWLCYCN
jgi:(p)ppGpp synthase/HD superfamily hydrolase